MRGPPEKRWGADVSGAPRGGCNRVGNQIARHPTRDRFHPQVDDCPRAETGAPELSDEAWP